MTRMYSAKLALLCAIGASSLAGCGSFKKSDDSDRGTSPADQMDKNLVGAWENDCEKANLIGSQFRKVKFKFDATLGFIREQSVYSDDKCLGERYVDKQNGAWAFVGDAKDTKDARQINFTITGSYVAPKNKEVADEFNRTKYCGFTDWAQGVEKNVTSAKCPSAFSQGQVIFDIYRIQNNALYLGKTGIFLTGTTDGSRPKEIDTSKPHRKK